MSARFKVFRWRAIGPLLFFFAVFVVLWILFADGIARRQSEDALAFLPTALFFEGLDALKSFQDVAAGGDLVG
jgi:hypothetical protein